MVVEQDRENQLELPDVAGLEMYTEAGPSSFVRPQVKLEVKPKRAAGASTKASGKGKGKSAAEAEVIDLDASEDESESTAGSR